MSDEPLSKEWLARRDQFMARFADHEMCRHMFVELALAYRKHKLGGERFKEDCAIAWQISGESWEVGLQAFYKAMEKTKAEGE